MDTSATVPLGTLGVFDPLLVRSETARLSRVSRIPCFAPFSSYFTAGDFVQQLGPKAPRMDVPKTKKIRKSRK